MTNLQLHKFILNKNIELVNTYTMLVTEKGFYIDNVFQSDHDENIYHSFYFDCTCNKLFHCLYRVS